MLAVSTCLCHSVRIPAPHTIDKEGVVFYRKIAASAPIFFL